MKSNIIKLTSITGDPVYIRESYSVMAVAAGITGDIKYTEIHFLSAVFRVKESAEDVVKALGWTE